MPSPETLDDAVANFGRTAKAKLANAAAIGGPEEQLRGPFEKLLMDVAELLGHASANLAAVGETTLRDLSTRPDYAITFNNALVGFAELKAPGKGADPRRFSDPHDSAQWIKLKALPNLIYTDGNSFSLWRNGELQDTIVHLDGDVASSGVHLKAPGKLLSLFQDFLLWQPIAPKSPAELAHVSARLCRLLRDEVNEQMDRGSAALTGLAADWRKLLFPEAKDSEFADGYAQAVTFGLLMARAQNIPLSQGLDRVARALDKTDALIGHALDLLTSEAEGQNALSTSLKTLMRVLDAVDWAIIGREGPEAWLYFYESFLSVYDNALRKATGSYYTPPEVVSAMVRLVDELLSDHRRFGVSGGLASDEVTIADPAVGTGTFILGLLRRIATTTSNDQGDGAVPGVIRAALKRLIGFEIQFGPFAVAELRILAEIADLVGVKSKQKLQSKPRLYLADTLGNPNEEEEGWIPTSLKPLAESRRKANAVKRAEPITVVIGNPPYKERAKGRGGWIENRSPVTPDPAPLEAWFPPTEWGVGAHSKHLRNLYVYFWRWATWKVFGNGAGPGDRRGIVCFITVAGFLNGPGFEKMRADLRRDVDEIWVIDCSPEGHQPAVSTRIFQGVQQPVCIVIAARTARADTSQPARVLYTALPNGGRKQKFMALAALSPDGESWRDCSTEPRAPFLPGATGAWARFVPLENLFHYNGSGVMPGRTWVIGPDADSLQRRWKRLISERDPGRKETLFHPHMLGGEYGDRYSGKLVEEGLPGHGGRQLSVANDTSKAIPPVRYGFRSFDRQWIIPDNRLINRPNPTLWRLHSDRQVCLTAPHDRSPSNGPSLTFTGLIPDLHHYNGRGGRAFPLWADQNGTQSNVSDGVLRALSGAYVAIVRPEDMMAYVAAVAAHPGFVRRFAEPLVQPGIRIPLTADKTLFAEAVAIGERVIWLHTFGERFADAAAGRPPGPPRMAHGDGPTIPVGGAIPSDPEGMPDSIEYEESRRRLHVGAGYVDHVGPEVWNYEISGKHVLTQWFSYRRRTRERPIIGDRRPPSPLGEIQPDFWLAEYTTELLNVLHVLGLVVGLEPEQDALLERILNAPLIPGDRISAPTALAQPKETKRRTPKPRKRRQVQGQSDSGL